MNTQQTDGKTETARPVVSSEIVMWPVRLGSKWKSKTIPGSVWELTMADSPSRVIRLNCGNFAWEGTVTLAQSEFEATRQAQRPGPPDAEQT